MANTKESLLESEVTVVCDFSENHWNSSQATVHPFVVFFTEENTLQHYSSECLEHNNVAVHLFQQKLIDLLKFENRLNFFYFSNGSAAQYKNKKNFSNLCYHQRDFGIDAG
ncbi:hypothetical protein AVEN_272509-1 [Araneus ventricosus]|uniref:Uncharacterized protein n=1 Tax=Araneus ventricosus TaxID=182803 RepID=A0A4Y2HDT0_ARAVE|nr:hypothetical protein AVEN_272509-1 [Araneus ventricosus]